MCLKNHS